MGRWGGISWAIVSAPNTSKVQRNFLFGASCVSASDCWTIGLSVNASGFSQTLIERWDGTPWAIVSSPNTSASQYNFLYGVTCVSATDCWAVGYYYVGSVSLTLTEHYAVPTPTPTPTATPTPTPSPTPTTTPSATPTPSPTATPTPTPAPTATPTVSPTPTPTVSPTPSPTVTPSPTPTITPTPT